VISQSDISSIDIAAPIKDTLTDKTIAVVRAKLPIKSLEAAMQNYTNNGHTYSVVDAAGRIFISLDKELLGKEAKANYPN
jgi:methyl-accepting chemotaxis protein PixJ